jgi:hypothetical protein
VLLTLDSLRIDDAERLTKNRRLPDSQLWPRRIGGKLAAS